jgi:hypothetical protein
MYEPIVPGMKWEYPEKALPVHVAVVGAKASFAAASGAGGLAWLPKSRGWKYNKSCSHLSRL